MVGTVAARVLADRGTRVVLLDSGRVGRGVTGRSTAKVTAQHSLFLSRIEEQHGAEAARAYGAANHEGVALIAELAARHGIDCSFERADSFVYATTQDGRDSLEGERSAAERAGLPMEIVADPGLPYSTTGALLLADQGQFQPVDFVAGLAATLSNAVFEESRALEWSESEVRTASGCDRARHVIMATHLPLGQVGQFHAHTRPHMHAVMAVPVEASRAPRGMYISVDEPKRSFRRHDDVDGAVMILTGPTFRHGDAEAEMQGFTELEAFAAEHFGCEGGGWRWSDEDYTPRDGLPYVGWSDGEGDSLLVATGFDAWGLSNGAAAGRVLADLIEGKDNPVAGLFDASRHSTTGLAKLAGNLGQFAADVVSGHAQGHPAGVPTLLAGEAAIVELDGRATGVHRDDSGALHAISAICTHMGCLLGWNPVDRSWDCPCHGSRFAAGGAVLHGPAVEPLARIDIEETRS